MPGKSSAENTDFMTPRAEYRTCLVGADSSLDDVPILDTRNGPNAQLVNAPADNAVGSAAYGRNAQISIAAIIQGFSQVKIQLWLHAVVQLQNLIVPGDSSSSDVSCTEPVTGEYVFVEERVLALSALSVFKDIPPGQYKVKISAVTGSGFVTLRESHAC